MNTLLGEAYLSREDVQPFVSSRRLEIVEKHKHRSTVIAA